MAAVAAAAAASRLKKGLVATRESPSRAAKTLAISRIQGETPPRTAVACPAPDDSEVSTGKALVDCSTDLYIP